MRALVWLVLVALTGLLACPGHATAQQTASQTPPPQAGDEPSAGETSGAKDATSLAAKENGVMPGEVEPTEYLVPDRDGQLQHLPNFKFEDFIRLFRLQQRLDKQPSYVIQEMEITGSVKAGQAELVAEFSIDVQDSSWVKIPLRLGQAILLAQAEYQGPGRQLLQFEDQQGYVSWIHSEPDKLHKIKLKLLVPLTTIGGETVLNLNLPRAPLSKLELQVPGDPIQARVSEGSELTQAAAGGGQTRLTALRVGGDFELAWGAPTSARVDVPIVLESTGRLQVRLDGRSVNTDARLSVRSFGGPFDRFQVRLSPGASLVQNNQFGVQLVPVGADDGKKGQRYEVRLKVKTVGPLDLRLVTERPYNVGPQDEILELAGFEVQGAVSQWGYVSVQVLGDWQVIWGTPRNIRQIDELPDTFPRDNVAAAFEYNLQPYSLTARVTPQQTRSSVEPEYLVSVGAQLAQLQARLKYNVRGAKLRTLDVELPGWEIDEVGPPALVNFDAALPSDGPVCSIPLLQAAPRQFEVVLRAHRAIAAGESELSLELPRPHANSVSPAIVVVLPADNVELSPRPAAITGLVPQSLRPQMKLPERQQDPLVYRTEGAESRFVTSMQTHAQSISADVQSTVSLDEQAASVEQTIRFQVAYEPVDSLTLLAPRSLPVEALSAMMDGQPIAINVPRSELFPFADQRALRVPLSGPRIGRLELQLRYAVAHEKPAPALTRSISVPLVMPGMGKLGHNQLRVVPQAGIQAALRGGPWAPDGNAAATVAGFQLAAPTAAAELGLALELKQRPTEGKTRVEYGWIRTLLVGGARQDRVLYRFVSGERQLRLALPADAKADSLEILLDLKPVSVAPDAAGEFVVPLTPGDGEEHLLEVSYSFPRHLSTGRLLAEPPEILPTPRINLLYWELIMPATDHLLLAPADFTGEYTWTRWGLLWHRQPGIDQAKLESLLGVPNTSPSSAQVNRYLFSTVGMVPALSVWWVPRSVLVFAASAVLLGIGLALIYFPRLRHPATVLTLGVLVLAGTLINPETSIVIAQAGLLGIGLVVLAGALARRTLPRVSATPLSLQSSTRGSSRAALDRSLTEAYFRASRGTQPSTATAPAVPASPESQP